MTTNFRGLDKYEKYFNEISIRFDQAYKDGKIGVSTKDMSGICLTLSKLVKEVKES